MTLRPTLQERAYQLAEEYATVAGIRQQLVREGYADVDAQLAAPTLRRELKRLCRMGAARAASAGKVPATE